MKVQLRANDGEIQEADNFLAAWEEFYNEDKWWKISWTSPNGKRLRIIKTGANPTENATGTRLLGLGACFMEDIIQKPFSQSQII